MRTLLALAALAAPFALGLADVRAQEAPKPRDALCFSGVSGTAGRIAAHDGFASLTLDDGTEVRLVDIVPTSALLGADRSEGGLQALVGEPVALARSTDFSGQDRYGRPVGDLVLSATQESVLRHLLREGLALVDPAVMSEQCLDAMFKDERWAQAQGNGFWADGGRIRKAQDAKLADDAGMYALVEGVVKSIGETRDTTYLNFGDDYKTDFTALIRRRDGKSWVDELKMLEGRKVRLRGVLEAWNGALIRLEHPRQVERLD
ncbi:MAG: thermonuclease family protein [Pseudomonadota bacterium]